MQNIEGGIGRRVLGKGEETNRGGGGDKVASLASIHVDSDHSFLLTLSTRRHVFGASMLHQQDLDTRI